jgi:hypothetical protein
MTDIQQGKDRDAIWQRVLGLAIFCIPVSAALGYLTGGWPIAVASAVTGVLTFGPILLVMRSRSISLRHPSRDLRRIVIGALILGIAGVVSFIVSGHESLIPPLIIALVILAVSGFIATLFVSQKNSTSV